MTCARESVDIIIPAFPTSITTTVHPKSFTHPMGSKFHTRLKPIPLGDIIEHESPTWTRFFLIKEAENVALFNTKYFQRALYIYNSLQLHSETSRKEINIRKHKDGLLLIAETEVISKQITACKGKVTHGSYQIQCSPHEHLNNCKGVIFHHEFKCLTDKEILEDLKPHCTSLVNVRQYKKDDRNLGLIEATFQSHRRPCSINLGFEALEVKPYIENVRQCKNCLKYNHGANFCKGRLTCARCGGHDHNESECLNDLNCSNCNTLGHKANDKSCPIWVEEKSIRELMAKEYLTYGLAKNKIAMKKTSFSEAISSESKEVQTLRKENTDLKKELDNVSKEMQKLREEIRLLREATKKPEKEIKEKIKTTKGSSPTEKGDKLKTTKISYRNVPLPNQQEFEDISDSEMDIAPINLSNKNNKRKPNENAMEEDPAEGSPPLTKPRK